MASAVFTAVLHRSGTVRHACLALSAWLLLFVPAWAAEPDDRLLTEGLEAVEASDFGRALQLFDQFKQKHPDDFRPYLYSARAMIRAGQLRDAGLELDDASQHQSSDPRQLLEYARARDQLGHAREAARVLSEVEDDPGLPPEGLWLLADVYYRLKEAKSAQRAFEKFASRRPTDPRIHLRRGQIFIYLEEFEKALTSIEEAVWASPGSAEGHFEMARTLRYGNNLEAARGAARKAVDLEPENPEYLHMLGIVCDGLKDHLEAVRHLEKAAESPRAFARIYFDLGNALRRAGETARAQQALQKYRELHSRQEDEANRRKIVEALVNQGQLRLRDGAVGEARSSFLRIVEVEPDNWLAHSFLSKIYLSSGTPHLARSHLDQLSRIDPDSSEGAFLEAFYWQQQRDFSKALEAGRRSRQLRPGDPETRNLLGNVYWSLGQLKPALDEYAAAVALAPERFDFKANYETARRKLNPGAKPRP